MSEKLPVKKSPKKTFPGDTPKSSIVKEQPVLKAPLVDSPDPVPAVKEQPVLKTSLAAVDSADPVVIILRNGALLQALIQRLNIPQMLSGSEARSLVDLLLHVDSAVSMRTFVKDIIQDYEVKRQQIAQEAAKPKVANTAAKHLQEKLGK